MLRLRTFGGLSIEGAGRLLTGAPTQRRRLALLALLAAAGERGLSRDKVLAYLWPENDTDGARHALRQLVYTVRRDLPADVLVSTPNDLRLNHELISSDIEEFHRALGLGDRGRAMAFYVGPFLDGFHLSDAPEFERWVEEERGRLAHLAAATLEAEAKASAAAGDLAGAVGWWRKLATLDPLNGRVAVALMAALESAGDRSGALQFARAHETLLRQELDSPPDPAILRLVERLRAERTTHEPPEPAASPGPSPQPGVRQRAVLPDQSFDRPLAAAPASSPSRASRRSRLSRTPVFAATVLATAGGLVAVWNGYAPPRSVPVPPSRTAVAVLPFSYHGAPELAYLGPGMVDLLSTDLAGAGLRSADPRALLSIVARDSGDGLDPARARAIAEALGAGMYVMGDVAEAGGRLRIAASLYDAREPGPVTQSAVEGTQDELFTLVDRITAQLLTGRLRGPGAGFARLAGLTTASLPALKAYLEGETAFRSLRLPEAEAAFQRAVAADSNFALAWYRLGISAVWGLHPELANEAAERAVAGSASLSERDRYLVLAFRAYQQGDADEAERLYRNVVKLSPNHVEAWYQLAETLFHYNWRRGRSLLESRAAGDKVLSYEPDNWQALMHLAALAVVERQSREADSLIDRFLELNPQSPYTLMMRAIGAAASHDDRALRQVTAELREESDGAILVSVWNVAVTCRDIMGAQRLAGLLTDPSRSPETRALGHVVRAYLELVMGRRKAADAELAAAQPLHPGLALEHRAAQTFAPFHQRSSRDLEAVRRQVMGWDARGVEPSISPEMWLTVHDGLRPTLRIYLLGLLAARAGEVDQAEQFALALGHPSRVAARDSFSQDLARGIRAELLALQAQPARALALLEEMNSQIPFEQAWTSPFYSQAHERFLRAELLHAAGRHAEALGWYNSMGDNSVYDLIYLAPAEFQQGRIYEALGDVGRAAQHYTRFLQLWKNADPELRPKIEEARRRVANLRPRTGHTTQ